jgi:AraC-like DNA-binding protein
MTITISQTAYWDLFKEVEESCKKIDEFDVIYKYPSQLGQGYSRFLDLRSGIELNIEHYQLKDNVILKSPDRPHPFELNFHLSGQFSDEGDRVTAGTAKFYSCGLATADTWEAFPDRPIAILGIHIEPELVKTFFGDCDRLKQLFRSDNQPYYIYNGSITVPMQIAIQQILECPYSGAIAKMYLESKVWELMALQLAQIDKDPDSQPNSTLKKEDRDRLDVARKILLDRLDNPPTLNELAKQIGLNECTLKRGFRQLFGTTVFGYLYQRRMEYARQLLLEREMNVKEVATLVGYTIQSRFATAFRKKFGINPKVFIKQVAR